MRFEVGEIDGSISEVGEKEGILEDSSSLFQGTGGDLQLELEIWVIFYEGGGRNPFFKTTFYFH